MIPVGKKVDELMRRRLKMNHRRQFVDPDENSLPKKLPPLNEKLGDGSWSNTQQTFRWWNKCLQSTPTLPPNHPHPQTRTHTHTHCANTHTLSHTHSLVTMKAEPISSNSFVRSSSVKHCAWLAERERERQRENVVSMTKWVRDWDNEINATSQKKFQQN